MSSLQFEYGEACHGWIYVCNASYCNSYFWISRSFFFLWIYFFIFLKILCIPLYTALFFMKTELTVTVLIFRRGILSSWQFLCHFCLFFFFFFFFFLSRWLDVPRPADKHKQIRLLARLRTIISGYGRKWLSPFSFLWPWHLVTAKKKRGG